MEPADSAVWKSGEKRDEAARVLAGILAESPLAEPSMEALRRAFSRFYKERVLSPEPEMEPLSANGVPGFMIRAPGAEEEKTLLFFHGGGFTIGSAEDHADLCLRLSQSAGVRVLSINYRLAPERPFPAAVLDCAAAYDFLLSAGAAPENIALAGISAGGTLALAVLLKARDRGLALPAAALLMSPATDLRFLGPSVIRNQATDWVTQARLSSLRSNYLAGADPCLALASPFFADLAGLCPLMIQAGTGELLLSDIEAFTDKAKQEGVPVSFEAWPYMFHCFQVFSRLLAQSRAAVEGGGAYLARRLGRP